MGSGLAFCLLSYRRNLYQCITLHAILLFFEWARERDNLTLKTGSIYVAFILVMKF